MDKAEEFIKDLTQRHVLGKGTGWCYSVEHQKRGMPHIHFLLILEQGLIKTPEQVDEYVRARIPPLPPIDDISPEAMQARRLWHLVTSGMMHDCNKACMHTRVVNGVERTMCSKYFPKPYAEKTELSGENAIIIFIMFFIEVRYTNYVRLRPTDVDESDAFRARANDTVPDLIEDLLPENDEERDFNEVRYQRLPRQGLYEKRTYEKCGLTYNLKRKRSSVKVIMDDSRVIPYNEYLTLKYGCHINIEYVFGQKACKYIFKYILKGRLFKL